MTTNLRRSIPPRTGGILSAVETAALTTVATLASILWVGVALPELPFVSALDPVGRRSMTIPLESALLGVYDPAGRHSAGRAGLTLLGLQADPTLPTPARLRTLALRVGATEAVASPLVVAARHLAASPVARAVVAEPAAGGDLVSSHSAPDTVAPVSADIGTPQAPAPAPAAPSDPAPAPAPQKPSAPAPPAVPVDPPAPAPRPDPVDEPPVTIPVGQGRRVDPNEGVPVPGASEPGTGDGTDQGAPDGNGGGNGQGNGNAGGLENGNAGGQGDPAPHGQGNGNADPAGQGNADPAGQGNGNANGQGNGNATPGGQANGNAAANGQDAESNGNGNGNAYGHDTEALNQGGGNGNGNGRARK